MSGVFGIINKNDQTDTQNSLHMMGKVMSHHSWYQVDIASDEEAGVGLGRIGIGIFNQEKQPVKREDGAIILFMAGEFYDYDDTRRQLEQKGYHFRDSSHAEFALRLYQDQGIDFVKSLEGVFILVIWDKLQHQLFIINDRFGFKPLYYAQFDNKFVFSPEIKGIFTDPRFSKSLNYTALAEYIRFQLLLGEKTFFEGISLLSPATVLCVNDKTLQLAQHCYWDWRQIQPLTQPLSDQEIAEEAERLLLRAMEVRLERAARPGVFLSGGLDSRLLLSLIPAKHQPVTTITYGHHHSRDAYLGGRIARAAGTKHHFFEFKDGNWVKDVVDEHLILTEGAHSWIHAHGMSTLPEARDLIDMNLSGHGGGSIIGTVFQKPSLVHAPDEIAFINGIFLLYTQYHSWPGLAEAEAQTLFTQRYHSKLSRLAFVSLREELARFDHPNKSLQSQFFNIVNHDRRMIFNSIIFNNAYIENRLPLYDYQLVEWSASLPLQNKVGKKIHRLVISRRTPKFALIPYDKNYRLPTTNRFLRNTHAAYTRINNVLHRLLSLGDARHTLYADYENYLRGELRSWAEDILFDKRTVERGIFRPEAIRSLMDRHLAGHEIHTIGKIAPIMTFEMMMRRFFDE